MEAKGEGDTPQKYPAIKCDDKAGDPMPTGARLSLCCRLVRIYPYIVLMSGL